MNDLIGGRYRIERRLGAGGMGAVYEATDTQSGARVAVKVVTAEVARNEVLLGRFEREARAARGLDTPHVVRALDAGRDGHSGLPFLVMEVLQGEDVRALFKRLGPIRPDLAVRIVVQACRGLDVAHAQRIVHRDVKPANLFLTRGPRPGECTVKILDFGIAKLAPDPESMAEAGELTSLTQTGSMLGSPLYMAPEQARGHKQIDGRADLWSLGVVLYQALTGVTPHRDSGALGELIIAICTEPAERVERLAPWVPPEVAAVVHRALDLDPTQRFQSAAEMHAALIALLPPGEANAAIHERMLVPLPEPERARVSVLPPRPPTLSQPPPAPPRGLAEAGSHMMAEPPTMRWSGAALGISAETPAAMQIGAPSSAPAAITQATPPKRRSSALAFVAMAALALVVGGSVAFVGLRLPEGSGQTTVEQTPAGQTNPGQASPGISPTNTPVAEPAVTTGQAETEDVPAPSAAPAAPSASGSSRGLAPWPRATTRASAAPKPPGKSDIYLGR
ncbi:serine/threonine-protein kinase [Polyangium jinanense]|uniref:Protein kinase n=1 Tax=Polyangium jinanense TaxID=2829994 RepID=A0A9X3X9G7_9BACT|nr:serine/threonine-protein kinase [Polyangium jinanense]MDC3960041.1 protein kinase [Polyangium jinanense]MDC3986177.1 protein kinase [Polyangium jinanense]